MKNFKIIRKWLLFTKNGDSALFYAIKIHIYTYIYESTNKKNNQPLAFEFLVSFIWQLFSSNCNYF